MFVLLVLRTRKKRVIHNDREMSVDENVEFLLEVSTKQPCSPFGPHDIYSVFVLEFSIMRALPLESNRLSVIAVMCVLCQWRE